MTDRRVDDLPALPEPEALGPLFEANRLAMWIQDGESLRVLAANRAAREAYGWDDTSLWMLTADDVRPRGVVSAQEFRMGDGRVWLVTELDGVERLAHDAEHDRVLHELVAVQEQVRSNIAERLHDGPVQTLTAVSLRIGLLKRAVDPTLEPKLTEAERLVVDALAALRAEMNAHRGHGEVAADLRGAISSTLRWLGLDGRYEVDTSGPEPSGAVAAMLYRVTQDLLARGPAPTTDEGPARVVRLDVAAGVARLTVPVADAIELGERLSGWVSAMDGTVSREPAGAGAVDLVVSVPVPS